MLYVPIRNKSLMLKQREFSPQLKAFNKESTFMVSNCSEIIETTNFQLDFKKFQSIDKKNIKCNIKKKASTDRLIVNDKFKDLNENLFQITKNSDEYMNLLTQSNNKTDRQILIQKKKQYAQSIRQKNKTILQQNPLSKRNQLNLNQSLNHSLINLQKISPTSRENRKSNHKLILQVQNDYYSIKGNQNSNMKVFKQSNQNKQNYMVNSQSIELTKNSKQNTGVSSKIKNIMNSTLQLNQNVFSQSFSHNYMNNKQNEIVFLQKKNKPPLSKRNSYAQIFDKKSTINALLSHQQKAGANTSSRQMSSLKKQKNALKSMTVSDFAQNLQRQQKQYQNPQEHYSIADERFGQTIENISRICDLEEKEKELQKEIFSYKNQKKNQFGLINKVKNKLQLNSRVYEQNFDSFEQVRQTRRQEEKQIVLLAKQNATFKRELTTFRKENSTIKKQLQNSKRHIKQLQQRAKQLIQKQQANILNYSRQVESVLSNISHQYPTKNAVINKDSLNNLEQILQCTQQQMFFLKGENKTLQLKVYMLQKKLVHEEQMNKKRLALEVNNWREKCNKLRNQLLRTKNSMTNPFMNSDWSISMDISRDE